MRASLRGPGEKAIDALMLIVGAAGVVLALDPLGEYFGVRATLQYLVLVSVVSLAAGFRLLTNPSPWLITLTAGSVAVVLLGFLRGSIDHAESVLRIFLIPYAVACAFVASPTGRFANPSYARIVLLAGVYVGLALLGWGLLGFFGGMPQLYHEEVFFLAPVLIAAARSSKKRMLPLAFCFVAAACVVSNKFTAYIVLVISGSVAVKAFIESGLWKRKAWVLPTATGVMAVSCGALATLVYLLTSDSAPSGSVDVRQYTYAIRWNQFFSAPLLGAESVDSSVIFVGHKDFFVPSHSDLLDVLAVAGIFGMTVFMVPLAALVKNLWRSGRFAWLGFVLGIVATAAVNPLLYQPPFLAVLAVAVYFSGMKCERR